MRKFILAVLMSIIMGNFTISQAATTNIYDYDAEDLYEELKDELEAAEDVPYEMDNFRRAETADLEDLQAWACDLGRKDGENWDALIVFRTNIEDEVEHAIVTCQTETFNAEPDELSQMLFIISIGMLEPLGLEESECEAILSNCIENPDADEWGVWSNGKYFKITPFNDGEICGYVISADDGN